MSSVKLQCLDNINKNFLVDSFNGVLSELTISSNNSSTGSLVLLGGLSINCTENSQSYLHGGSMTVRGGASIDKSLYVNELDIHKRIIYNGEPYKGQSQWNYYNNILYYTNGNVGIGITNPNYTLDVDGTINLSNNGNLKYLNNSYYSDDWSFIQNTINDINRTIGNVGIGTTDPQYKLEIHGSVKNNIISTFNNNVLSDYAYWTKPRVDYSGNNLLFIQNYILKQSQNKGSITNINITTGNYLCANISSNNDFRYQLSTILTQNGDLEILSSNTYGNSWTNISSQFSNKPIFVKSSASNDGSTFLLNYLYQDSVIKHKTYISTNYGSTFNEIIEGNKEYSQIILNNDGSKIFMVNGNNIDSFDKTTNILSTIYTSLNGNFINIDMSNSGQYIVGITNTKFIILSYNYVQQQWYDQSLFLGIEDNLWCGCDETAQYIIILKNDLYYFSEDYGINWKFINNELFYTVNNDRHVYSKNNKNIYLQSIDGQIYNFVYSSFNNFTIEGAGNVGIGVLEPTAKLDLDGDFKIIGEIYKNNNLYFTPYWTNENGFNNIYYTKGNVSIGTTNCSSSLNVNGKLYASNEIYLASDERLKDNIETIQHALEQVNCLRGVYYKMNNCKKQGVIAQEIKKIIPEIIHSYDDKLCVSYNNLIGLLVQAIKELEIKITELEKVKLITK